MGDKWLASNACARATTESALDVLSGASATLVDFNGKGERCEIPTSWLILVRRCPGDSFVLVKWRGLLKGFPLDLHLVHVVFLLYPSTRSTVE